ncbi:uncharacterized protein [Lepeophtheirus salmonis]|uniref:uncharacterized protein isoform X1 n=1 Tax=Lepeophtheirus salmonis TaxID=72036 RepID=UPI003AF3444E
MEIVDLTNQPEIRKKIETLPVFSIDLLKSSLIELDFLKTIDDAGIYYEPDVILKGIYRYETYWLPFLTSAKGSSHLKDLNWVPPLDIHWVWHVHMLAPVAYRADTISVAGRFIGHQLNSIHDYTYKMRDTKDAWELMYPEVPFNDISSFTVPEGYIPKFSYDIASAARRQRDFYYQVALSHYRCENFLKDAVQRYKMYLYLKKENKETFLVPCYDIDLVWHSHQVHPSSYNHDTVNILGFVLRHDDSVNDRSEGSKLNNSDELTRMLWKNTFNVAFGRPGSMFRGRPPNGRLFTLTKDYQRSLLSPKEMDLEILEIEVIKELDTITKEKKKVNPNGISSEGEDEEENIGILTVSLQQDLGEKSGKAHTIELISRPIVDMNEFTLSEEWIKPNVSVNEGNNPRLIFRVIKGSSRKKSWFRRIKVKALSNKPLNLFRSVKNCRQRLKEEELAEQALSIRHSPPPAYNESDQYSSSTMDMGAIAAATNAALLEKDPTSVLKIRHVLKIEKGFRFWKDKKTKNGNDSSNTEDGNSSELDSNNYLRLDLTVAIKNEVLGKAVTTHYTIQPGTFYTCIIPANIEKLWGPIPLQKLPIGVNNQCRAVTHGICNERSVREMTVYLIHSLPLLMSAVQIFVQDKMAVVAHLVGLEQLGYERELGMTNDVMKNDNTWRAMLIKDNEGDWGVCAAAWRGMKSGTPGVPGTKGNRGKPGTKGSPGYFALKFVPLRSRRISSYVNLANANKDYSFSIDALKVNLRQGTFSIGPWEPDVVQYTCLAFVVTTLYLLVQPRPKESQFGSEKRWEKGKRILMKFNCI